MTARRFFVFLGIVFVIAAVVYAFSTPHGGEIPLIGLVDGNEVIVSPQITGRIVKLLVDEGTEVKQGQLIAELDRAELKAQVASDEASIRSFAARVVEEKNSLLLTDAQTQGALEQARATLTSTQAQLAQAEANLWRDEQNTKRTLGLYEGGVASAQDRDTAEATLKSSQAQVQSLKNQVKAQEASLAVAEANRKQLNVIRSEVASLEAQQAQARADKTRAMTQLGYTEIYAPINGIVSVRVAKQGEVVNAGSPIVVVVDVDHLWVRADVEESYIDSIHFGDKMRVRLPSGDVLDGQLIFKGVESDFATQRDVSRTKRDIKTFAIKVAVPNPNRRLFTGMTATVLLPRPSHRKA